MRDIIVTSRHCRIAGLCLTPGTRDFFQAHNLDFKDFIRNGIPAEKLLSTKSALAERVVSIARQESEREAEHGR